MANLPGAKGVYSAYGWHISNNVWKPGSLIEGTDYRISSTYNPANLTAGTTFNWTFPDWTSQWAAPVRAYPSVYFGPNPHGNGRNPTDPYNVLPVQVRDIGNLTFDYDYSFGGTSQGFNVSLDLWFTSKANGNYATITNEVMIWLHQGSLAGGTANGAYSASDISGRLFYNQKGYDSLGTPYTAIVSDIDLTSGTLDLAAILHNLQSLGIISSNEYLADIEIGAEVAYGKGWVRFNNVDFEIETKGLNGPKTIYDVPGSGAVPQGGQLMQSKSAPLLSTQSLAAPANPVLAPAVGFSRLRAVGNLDGAGATDLIWQDNNGKAAVRLMTASGANRIVTIGSPGLGWRIAGSGDFNGDGKADILWHHDSGQTAIWFMDGGSRIGGGTVVNNPGPGWRIAATGDFNGDGKEDILWQNVDGQAAIWLMDGTRRLSGPAVGSNPGINWYAVAAADFDGDGKDDILWQSKTGQMAIWFMDGGTVKRSPVLATNPGPSWTVAGTADFNGDGKADIVLRNDNGQAAIWLMNGSTLLSAANVGNNPGVSWRIAGTADFSGDGRPDILWQNQNGQSMLWTMKGTSIVYHSVVGRPGVSGDVVTDGFPLAPKTVANDFDGDGKSDIIWQHNNGQASIWFMNGAAARTMQNAGLNPGSAWRIKASGDFNGDGKTDLVWQNNAGEVSLWLMDGVARIGSPTLDAGTAWQVVGAGDFDGDGDSDIVLEQAGGRATIWLMNGGTRVSSSQIGGAMGAGWHIKAVGDFNGDGRADLAWQNDAGQTAIWLMNGSSQLPGSGAFASALGAGWKIAAAGDFDGDGKADLLWENANGQAAISLMDGANERSTGLAGTALGGKWHISAAGDYNGDGKADILWQNDNGQPLVRLMDGFSQIGSSALSNPSSAWHIPAGVG